MSIIGGFVGIVISSGALIMGMFQEFLYNSYIVSNLFLTNEMISEDLNTPSLTNQVKIEI